MRFLAALLLLAAPVYAQQSITLPTDMVTPDPAQGAAPAPAPAPAPGSTITLPAPGTPGSAITLPGTGGLPGLGGAGMAPGGAPAAANEVQIQVVAFKGSATGRSSLFFDEELRPMKKVLQTLQPNDTFEIIASEKKTIPMGEETRFTVNGIYTAYVTPKGVREAPEGGGQLYDLETRIEMLNGNDYIDALRARGEAAPQQALALRGMDLDVGELIVLVVVAPDSQNQGPQGDEQSQSNEEQQEEQTPEEQQAKQNELKSEQQQQQDEEQKKEQEEQKEAEGDGEGGGEAPQLAQQGEGEGEGSKEAESSEGEQPSEVAQAGTEENEDEAKDGQPKDMQTIDAILQNLEEKDRQEQRNARYRRSRVVINGDWW